MINFSSAEVPDVAVLKTVKRAGVMLEPETSQEIDYSNCSKTKEFIADIANAYE